MDMDEIVFGVLDFLDPLSLSQYIVTCRRNKRLLHLRLPWWERHIHRLYHCHERTLPEFAENAGKAFLRLTAHGQCFSCLGPAWQRHRFYLLRICSMCQRKDVYRMISQSCAIAEYKLRKKDLMTMYCVHVPNTFFSGAPPTKLYLLTDVQNALCVH